MSRLKKFGIVTILLLAACSFMCLGFIIYEGKRKVTKEALLSYIRDPENGLFKSDSIGNVKYAIYYKPSQLAIRNDSLLNRFYFILKCSYFNQDMLGDMRVPYDYSKVIKNLSFNLKSYLYGVYDKTDTVNLRDFVYARTYGSSNSSDVSLVFDRKQEFKQFEIVVWDFVFEKYQKVYFTFNHSDIKNCPEI
jgi:hypothetical protein